MHEMVPAEHARESVVAVGLRVKRVMALEKRPICERDRFEIFLIKHFKQDFLASYLFLLAISG
jgi:hypothetical protein